jgi:hypothetical protein
MTAVRMPASYRLTVGDLDNTSIQVARVPHLSVLHWLVEAASSTIARHPVADAVAARLTPDARRIFPALGIPNLDRLPNVLTSPIGDSTSVEAFCRRLAGHDPSLFADEIRTLWNGQPPQPWQTVAARPREWLTAAARAVGETWALGRAHWAAAEVSMRQEEMRLGASAVTGNLADSLNAIDPRLRIENGTIAFASQCTQRLPLGQRKLALVPLIVPGRHLIVGFDDPAIAYVAYTLAASDTAPRPGTSQHSQPADGLTELVGPIRAATLRALDRPHTMTVLARSMHIAPSTLTYHCNQLVKAGLLTRRPQGRTVWLSRSPRGDRLIALMR